MSINNITTRKELLNSKQLKVSCIVPVHNEEEGIKKFLISLDNELKQHTNNYEIVVVDDGSTDATSQSIDLLSETLPLKFIKLSRNFGKETALTAGLEHCTGDVAILIDSDFQHPFELIEKFLQQWANGYDMAYGVRQNRDDESLLKRAFTKCFYKIMRSTSNMNIIANAGDFRLLDRKIIDTLNSCEERVRFMKGLYAWVGYKSIGIPFQVKKRELGTSSWSFTKLAELAIVGITSFSNIPLRFWSLVGLGISLLSFFIALFVISKTLIFGVDVPGYASLMVTIIFFGGIQLFSIGVLGEYIARIFNEVKRRPKYIIEKKSGFK